MFYVDTVCNTIDYELCTIDNMDKDSIKDMYYYYMYMCSRSACYSNKNVASLSSCNMNML